MGRFFRPVIGIQSAAFGFGLDQAPFSDRLKMNWPLVWVPTMRLLLLPMAMPQGWYHQGQRFAPVPSEMLPCAHALAWFPFPELVQMVVDGLSGVMVDRPVQTLAT